MCLPEPLGSTPPKLSISSYLQTFSKGSSFTLLCPAQGSPTPLIFRSVELRINF